MRALRRDYYLRYRHEESIADSALIWRRAAKNYNDGYFNIIDFVENVLRPELGVRIILFDARDDEHLAYVMFDPLTLHVDREIWDLARTGDPYARFIIAHEVGHLVMHKDDAKAFSIGPTRRIQFAQKEFSAEWQANAFAAHFLLPSHIVAAIGDLQSLLACGVNKPLAQERLAAVRSGKFGVATYSGDACANCGNFTMVCNGTCLKCDTCGQSTRFQ